MSESRFSSSTSQQRRAKQQDIENPSATTEGNIMRTSDISSVAAEAASALISTSGEKEIAGGSSGFGGISAMGLKVLILLAVQNSSRIY